MVTSRCKECQRQTGSAFGMSMPVKKDTLTVTGPTKRFTRIVDSGNGLTGAFCPERGVRIYHVLESAEDVLSLKPGTLDDTSWLRPDRFIWMKSGQGWVSVPDGAKALEGQA
ncbi:MAG: glutathione-dependent formaldehyde-activating [Rhodospirillales bacterium]|nr:glutathione-dependent formaldehyde-activating [Rhodospirillales bacterium]